MPRIAYQPESIAEPRDIVESIRKRRGGVLLNLDRMLLHSPAFAKGWNALLREVRNELSLSPKLRELAICIVAMINDAEYEFHHHAPEFLDAGGTTAQVDALRRLNAADADSALFDDTERAVIQLTVEMTRDVQVKKSTFDTVESALANDQQVVELAGVIATYNMVSRFLAVLEIEPEQ